MDIIATPAEQPAIAQAPTVPSIADRRRYYLAMMDRGMRLLERIERAEKRGDLAEAARMARALTKAYALLDGATR